MVHAHGDPVLAARLPLDQRYRRFAVREKQWRPSTARGGTRSDEICFLSLRELAGLLRSRQLSAREVMAAHLEQIRRWNPRLNAIVAKLDDESCLALADAADARVARGDPPGALHGLPWAFKDLEPAVGFPCTRGSPIFRNDRPTADSVLVERLRQAGVVPIGKTNTSEFGMGSNTYNGVYGTTRNPYDATRCAGGSSGGAAAGVACGMLPAADGSDLAGSLRNPGNFNNVVGFRPTVGLVPTAPNTLPLLGFAVKGPIARSRAGRRVSARRDGGPRRAGSRSAPRRIRRSFLGASIAASRAYGLHGARISAACRSIAACAACSKRSGAPSRTSAASSRMRTRILPRADEVFLTLRAFRTWTNLGPLLAAHRAEFKPEAIREIEDGARLSAAQISSAMVRHGQILESMRRFQDTYPFMLCAVNQVPPFDAESALA